MIGYYVHHQGRGHLQRMTSIAALMAEPLTVLSSLSRPDGGPEWVQLPTDDTGSTFVEPLANGTLHWAPRQHPGLRTRMAMIAAWIAEQAPDLVVVDVSVEVALLCRLLGVPTVVVAMRGDRHDRPHRSAYDSAHALIATWAAEFDDDRWPPAWSDKTFHAGPISRFQARQSVSAVGHDGPRRVLVLWGAGGSDEEGGSFTTEQLLRARGSAPGWAWRFAGGTGEHRVDSCDVWGLLCWADVVITHAGQNAVAEVAASRTPAIVIADARPHGEQVDTAGTLDAAGLAVGLAAWPDDDRWSALLAGALALDGTAWARWLDHDGALLAADFLTETVASLRSCPAAQPSIP
jgi:UDP-N-acetylglucosamine--N-acetylmuramyl-(pentapeptide) pyrophosphoryl-undecaprenol N-acetylglucosamine transferase